MRATKPGMAAAHFSEALAYILMEEGGFVDDPRDRGGATNKGVTQAVYDAWRRESGEPQQSVRLINVSEVKAIYRRNYWAPVRGDDLPRGLDYAVFDFAINSGPSRAARFLQVAVGAVADGIIGPRTIEAIGNPLAAIDALCDRRQAYLEGLSDFASFGDGWTARVIRVRDRAKAMAA